jgi:hypothetical protein
MSDANDFYEDDEPIEDVVAAWTGVEEWLSPDGVACLTMTGARFVEPPTFCGQPMLRAPA